MFCAYPRERESALAEVMSSYGDHDAARFCSNLNPNPNPNASSPSNPTKPLLIEQLVPVGDQILISPPSQQHHSSENTIIPSVFHTASTASVSIESQPPVSQYSSRSLLTVTMATPNSGLLIIDDTRDAKGNIIYICLLQHNVVSLRPHYRTVKELKSAISPKECVRIIQNAEDYAIKSGGWTNSRHTNYATTDIPVDKLYGEDNHIDEIVNRNILPEIAAYYGLTLDSLHIGELFIVKYEYKVGQQSGLQPHVDGTPWSFVVSLNDAINFTGGGTRFIHNQSVYRPSKAGSAILFSGKNLHEGIDVTGGVRYILTGFCEYVNECDEEYPSPHDVYMRDYDRLYDGHAAAGGIRTGDVIKGVYDEAGHLHCLDELNTLRKVVEDIKGSSTKVGGVQGGGGVKGGVKGGKQGNDYTFLIERLISTDYEADVDGDVKVDGEVIGATNCSGEGQVSSTIMVENQAVDDRDILDLIHNADQYLSVGQYWKFDDIC